MNSVLTVQKLTKTYGLGSAVEVHALREVSFSIERGSFTALMGRSGSGKSTLLHQLGLIDSPTTGAIHVDGVSILDLTEKEKTEYRLQYFGHIFQEYALIAELTALENVALPAMALTGTSSVEQARNLLALVELGERTSHYPHELSGGEQQRVAIARALVNNPKILFADEPTANLDSISADIILNLFTKLNKERGQTIVMITHEPEDRRYVDSILTLKDGLIDHIEAVR
jgi:putative ABC transport system ATP-binding protein